MNFWKCYALGHVQLFCDPWTVAHKTPLSMGFPRQEYWSGLPFSFPGDLSNPWIEPRSPELQVDSLLSKPPGKPPYELLLNYKSKLARNPNLTEFKYCHFNESHLVNHPITFFFFSVREVYMASNTGLADILN